MNPDKAYVRNQPNSSFAWGAQSKTTWCLRFDDVHGVEKAALQKE